MGNVRRISKKYYFRQIVACWLMCFMLFGLPAQVVRAATPVVDSYGPGSAGVSQTANTTTVNLLTEQAVINWSNFNTIDGELLQFLKNNGLDNFAVLNRVSGSATLFNGDLEAIKGTVFIINPRGITFGPTSYIQARNLIASSMKMSNGDFLDATVGGNLSDDMRFTNPSAYSGARLVENQGEITNADSVYLVGKNVLNAGTITANEGGLVAMVAGDEMILGKPGSDVIVKKLVVYHIENHTVDNGAIGGTSSNLYDQFGIDASSNTGTVSAVGGDLVLAAGDIWSNAIENVQDLTATAQGDIHFEEAINITGDMWAEAGLPTAYEEYLDFWSWSDGYYTVERGGDVLAADTITAGGNIDIIANGVELDAAVEATTGYLKIAGRQSKDPVDGYHDVETAALTAGGDIEISVTGGADEQQWVWDGYHWTGWHMGHWEPISSPVPGTITLNGDAVAGGNLTLFNNTNVTLPATLQAGVDIILENGEAFYENCETLTGKTELTLIAGNEIDPGIKNTVISVIDSDLTMQQGLSIDTADYLFGNQNNTNLTLISDNGSVTSTRTSDGGLNANAADEWLSIGATANDDITLSGPGSITTKALYSTNGDIDVTTSHNLQADGLITSGGEVRLKAGRDITLEQAVSANGKMDLFADNNVNNGGDMHAKDTLTTTGDGDIEIQGNNVTLDEPVTADGGIEIRGATSTDPYRPGPDGQVHADELIAKGGDIEISASDTTIHLHGNVTTDIEDGEDIILHNNTIADDGVKLDAGRDIHLDHHKTLDGTGTLTLEADRDVYLGGDTTAGTGGAGNLYLTSDADDNDDGIIEAKGNIVAAGNVSISGNVELTGADGVATHTNQKIEAQGTGSLDVNPSVGPTGVGLTEPYVHKTSTGDLEMSAGREIALYSHVTVDTGKLDIAAGGTAGLYGNLKSSDDMTLSSHNGPYSNAYLRLHGNAWSTDGSVEMTGNGYGIYTYWEPWGRNVKAGENIILNDNTHVTYTAPTGENQFDAGEDVYLRYSKDLTANYALNVKAGDDIIFGAYDKDNPSGGGSAGDVAAGGDLILDAQDDVYAYGNLTATGDITISSSDSTTYLLTDLVEATGNVNLENNTEAADGILIHAVNGDVIVGVETETVNPADYPGMPGLLPGVYTDTYLEGYGALTVEAGSDIIIGGDLTTGTSTAGAMTLTAGDSISVKNATSQLGTELIPGNMVMTATNGDIAIGNLKRDYDLNPGGDLVFEGGNLQVNSNARGDMTLSAPAGNISFKKAWTYGKYVGSGQYQGGNMNMTAGGDITAGVIAPAIEVAGDLLDEAVVISQGGAMYSAQDMTLDAGNDIKGKWVNTSGAMSMEAGHDILIGGVVPSVRAYIYDTDGWNTGNVEMFGDNQDEVLNVYKAGYLWGNDGISLLADNDIKTNVAFSGGDIEMTAVNGDILVGGVNPFVVEVEPDVYELREFDKGGRLETYDGAITLSAGRDISLKMARARDDITMTAVDNITLRSNLPGPGWDEPTDRTQSGEGDIRLHALNGDISIVDGYMLIGGYFHEEGHQLNGGVSLIADNGKIFSPGGDDDTLNVTIWAYSDQAADVGVELPEDPDQKAAIVIISAEDLKLGPGAELKADGIYDDTGVVDDRDAIDFLDIPATIGGVLRDEGDPFDVAVYVASTDGDVDVSSPVEIGSFDEWYEEFVPEGAMVIDALDTVTFDGGVPGGSFETSLADGDVGDRLEVCSRITEWLFQAVGRLPYAGDAAAMSTIWYGNPDSYILRGAGLGNPAITDGRAWVLENPVPPPPLYREAGATAEEEEFAEGGCPALMEWLANEIGIPEEDLQVAIADAFALNTDIQPCEMCARLKDASTILGDSEGTYIPALAQVVNEFIAPDAPITPEQMALIASALASPVTGTQYAAAGQWLDALAEYVGILNTEMGFAAAESVAFATKYVTPITEGDNASLTAYVEARMAALGG